MNERRASKSAPTAAGPPPPDCLATPSSPNVTKEPNLPPFAADADDLEAIKKAVDDAAAVSGALWFSYLFALFYFAVAAGAVTHKDLFLENPVKLPFLNIELPLLAFFFLAPILFLVVHAYTLAHLVMLTDKAKRFSRALNNQIGDENGLSKDESVNRAAVRAGLQGQLPSNIFVQILAGPKDVCESPFGWSLRAIGWITIVIAPVLLLLMMQIQFLPFHSSFITWTQRLAFLADLILVWWLWRKILIGREAYRHRPAWTHWAWVVVAGLPLSLAAVLLSVAVVTFPGEWQEDHLPGAKVFPKFNESQEPSDGLAQSKEQSFGAWIASYRDWALNSEKVSLHDWIFTSPVDQTTRHRWLPFSNTLVLTGFNVLEGLGIDDPEKAKWRDFIFRARGRDLKGARFDFASLPRVDFTGANLVGASLDKAQLDRVSFDRALLQGASLDGARLQGASLDGAQLQGASLNNARLQGASLRQAKLQGASLLGAQLQGALLLRTELQGASLTAAQLQGASLVGARLQGASLDSAQLEGASLFNAELQGAWLVGADLRAADLSGALLWRAYLGARLSRDLTTLKDLRISDASDLWLPVSRSGDDKVHPRNADDYRGLRQMLQSLPPGQLRDRALRLIARFDCANTDPALAGCDDSLLFRRDSEAWPKRFEDARVEDADYARALAATLKALVCSSGDGAEHVVRGLISNNRLANVDVEAPALVDSIMSKDCPVSASLTDGDKADLLQIKRDAIMKAGQ